MLHCSVKNVKCYFLYDAFNFIIIEFLNTGSVKMLYNNKLKLIESEVDRADPLKL